MATKQLIRNAFPIQGGVKLVYCTQDGHYIGEVIATGVNSASLRAMSEDFRDFTEEEAQALAATDPPNEEVHREVSRIITRQQ